MNEDFRKNPEYKEIQKDISRSRAKEMSSAIYAGTALVASMLIPFPLAIVGVPAAAYLGYKSLKSYKEGQEQRGELKAYESQHASEDMQALRAMAIAQYRGQGQDMGNGRNWSEGIKARSADRTTQL